MRQVALAVEWSPCSQCLAIRLVLRSQPECVLRPQSECVPRCRASSS